MCSSRETNPWPVARPRFAAGSPSRAVSSPTPDVREEAQLEAAPDAVAADHRDRRRAHRAQRRARRLDALAVVLRPFRRAARFLEVLDVGAGREGPDPGARDERDAYAGVVVELLEDRRQPAPHRVGDSVVLVGGG